MRTHVSYATLGIALVLAMFASIAQAEEYAIPWFSFPGADGGAQSELRIGNDADESATVTIHAVDDTGARVGSASLTLGAFAAVVLDAGDLQTGNTDKGLSAGLGSQSGDVRLIVESDVPVVPSAYVRAADDTLATLHDFVLSAATAAGGSYRYDVPIFHPASNTTRESRLRLINRDDTSAQVRIEGRDDTGAMASAGAVELTLSPGGAQTLTAQQLEAGVAGTLTGRLGVGTGNWRLTVVSDRAIDAINLTISSTGQPRNLSTSAVDGWAPLGEAAFKTRFLERVIVKRDGQGRSEPARARRESISRHRSRGRRGDREGWRLQLRADRPGRRRFGARLQ